MAFLLTQKFAPGTREATWLVARDPMTLVEWTNWGDQRWSVAFRGGQQHAAGRNTLGLLLRIGRERLMQGRLFSTAPEADWTSLP